MQQHSKFSNRYFIRIFLVPDNNQLFSQSHDDIFRQSNLFPEINRLQSKQVFTFINPSPIKALWYNKETLRQHEI